MPVTPGRERIGALLLLLREDDFLLREVVFLLRVDFFELEAAREDLFPPDFEEEDFERVLLLADRFEGDFLALPAERELEA